MCLGGEGGGTGSAHWLVASLSANLSSRSLHHCTCNRVHAPGRALQDSTQSGSPLTHLVLPMLQPIPEHPKLLPASGPLHLLLPLRGMLSPRTSTQLAPSNCSGLISNITSSEWPSLTHLKQLLSPHCPSSLSHYPVIFIQSTYRPMK